MAFLKHGETPTDEPFKARLTPLEVMNAIDDHRRVVDCRGALVVVIGVAG